MSFWNDKSQYYPQDQRQDQSNDLNQDYQNDLSQDYLNFESQDNIKDQSFDDESNQMNDDNLNTNFKDFQQINNNNQTIQLQCYDILDYDKENFDDQLENSEKQLFDIQQNDTQCFSQGDSKSTQISDNQSIGSSNRLISNKILSKNALKSIISQISQDQPESSDLQKYFELTQKRIEYLRKYEIKKYVISQDLIEEIERDRGQRMLDEQTFIEKYTQYFENFQEQIKGIYFDKSKTESREYYQKVIIPIALSHIDFFFQLLNILRKVWLKKKTNNQSPEKQRLFKLCLCGQILIGDGSFNNHVTEQHFSKKNQPLFKLYQCFKTGRNKQGGIKNFLEQIVDYLNGLNETEFSQNYKQFMNDYHLSNAISNFKKIKLHENNNSNNNNNSNQVITQRSKENQICDFNGTNQNQNMVMSNNVQLNQESILQSDEQNNFNNSRMNNFNRDETNIESNYLDFNYHNFDSNFIDEILYSSRYRASQKY